ncbi:MAG: hypothetical protein QF535_03625, partial [Anaerolineales bacterium]|nr:hypothetical protein [Anaerolineales bacterium]
MKKILSLIIVILVIVGIFTLIGGSEESTERTFSEVNEFSTDTTIEEDLTINPDTQTVMKDGARLVVKGNLDVQGQIACEDGQLHIVVEGSTSISDSIVCDIPEELSDSGSGIGIALVSSKGFTMTEGAVVESNGSIQIVENEELLATTKEEINALYDSVEEESGEGIRIGPFVDKEGISASAPNIFSSLARLGEKAISDTATKVLAQPAPPP